MKFQCTFRMLKALCFVCYRVEKIPNVFFILLSQIVIIFACTQSRKKSEHLSVFNNYNEQKKKQCKYGKENISDHKSVEMN